MKLRLICFVLQTSMDRCTQQKSQLAVLLTATERRLSDDAVITGRVKSSLLTDNSVMHASTANALRAQLIRSCQTE